MDNIKTVSFCPLGSKCEEIKDGAIHICAWLIEIEGQDPTTGETIKNRRCSMAWLPILMIENSKQQRNTGVAIESFRNEMVQNQQQFIQLAQKSDIQLLNG